jgi:thiol:disulfide interchange protein
LCNICTYFKEAIFDWEIIAMNRHTAASSSIIFFLLFAIQDNPSNLLWAQKKLAPIPWIYNLTEGLALANKEHKPLMIHFTAAWCAPCQEMKKKTFPDSRVAGRAEAFIPVRIDIEEQREVAAKYNALARVYGGMGIPNILFLASDGAKLKQIVGYQSPEELLAAMNAVLALKK